MFGAIFQLSVESNLCLLWFGFATLCDWLEKLAPLSQPMGGSKTKTKRDSLTCVFPRLAPVNCICFQFWLVLILVRLFWLARVVGLVFSGCYDAQIKTAL